MKQNAVSQEKRNIMKRMVDKYKDVSRKVPLIIKCMISDRLAKPRSSLRKAPPVSRKSNIIKSGLSPIIHAKGFSTLRKILIIKGK